MTPEVFFPLITGIIFLAICINTLLTKGSLSIAVILAILSISCLNLFWKEQLPEAVAAREAKKAIELEQEKQDLQPRIIRTTSTGCSVYAFKDLGRWHYFTQCPNSTVTTESSTVIPSGKTSKVETEVITTR